METAVYWWSISLSFIQMYDYKWNKEEWVIQPPRHKRKLILPNEVIWCGWADYDKSAQTNETPESRVTLSFKRWAWRQVPGRCLLHQANRAIQKKKDDKIVLFLFFLPKFSFFSIPVLVLKRFLVFWNGQKVAPFENLPYHSLLRAAHPQRFLPPRLYTNGSRNPK